jgi:hypothetical protein
MKLSKLQNVTPRTREPLRRTQSLNLAPIHGQQTRTVAFDGNFGPRRAVQSANQPLPIHEDKRIWLGFGLCERAYGGCQITKQFP